MFVANFTEIDRAVFPPALHPERQTCIQTYTHFVNSLPYFLHTMYSENVIKQQFKNAFAYLNSKLLFLERWKCHCWPHFDQNRLESKIWKKQFEFENLNIRLSRIYIGLIDVCWGFVGNRSCIFSPAQKICFLY